MYHLFLINNLLLFAYILFAIYSGEFLVATGIFLVATSSLIFVYFFKKRITNPELTVVAVGINILLFFVSVAKAVLGAGEDLLNDFLTYIAIVNLLYFYLVFMWFIKSSIKIGLIYQDKLQSAVTRHAKNIFYLRKFRVFVLFIGGYLVFSYMVEGLDKILLAETILVAILLIIGSGIFINALEVEKNKLLFALNLLEQGQSEDKVKSELANGLCNYEVDKIFNDNNTADIVTEIGTSEYFLRKLLLWSIWFVSLFAVVSYMDSFNIKEVYWLVCFLSASLLTVTFPPFVVVKDIISAIGFLFITIFNFYLLLTILLQG